MKTPLFLFASLLVMLFSCNSASRQERISEAEELTQDEQEKIEEVEKATAIFWVDKRSRPKGRPTTFIRSAKAKVIVRESGRVDLLNFYKPQPEYVVKYLTHRLELFRVTKVMLDSGYVHTGEQYVQLRYLPDLAERFK